MFRPYHFTAPIEEHDVGSERYTYKVVWLPQKLTAELPLDTYPKLQIEAEIDGVPIEAAFTPVRGRHYLLLSQRLMKKIGKAVGDDIDVHFAIADQSAVHVPDVLHNALMDNPDMKALWDDTTPGKKRSLAYLVSSAKTESTQEKRIARVFSVLAGEVDLKGNPL